MNIKKIRDDFPLLQTKLRGKPIIYFDNGCQTLRPRIVIKAIVDYYQDYSACGGRSIHKLGEIVTQKCEEARRIIARFINAKQKEEIVFTRNTTEGINLVAHSIGLKQNDIVLTTDKEHNSNLIPWQILTKKTAIIHKIVPSKKDNTFDLERFRDTISEQVKLVSVVYTSNLDGVSLPIKKITKIAHQYGAMVLVDAAQAVPHQAIDVRELDVDFLAFSGHKMVGPSGMGILYGKYSLLKKLEPFMVGGDTVEYSTYKNCKFLPPPEKFEAGLQNYGGIIGLGEAVKYLKQVNLKNIKDQEYKLNKFITDELRKNPLIKIIGPQNPSLRGGIVSFYVKNFDCHQIALILDESNNIMVRSGQFCVHSWFNSHNIRNAVRLSLYFYNTLEEAQIFINSLNKILNLI